MSTPLSAADIEAAVEGEILLGPARPEPTVYLGRTEVARHLGLAGLASLTGVSLPTPDAIIGDRKGWLVETIDEWNANRPGRGRWGPRNT